MNLEYEQKDGVTVVRLSGRLDAAGAGEIRNQLQELADNNDSLILLNFHGVDFIDSTGLGLVVSIYRRVREHGRDLVVCSLTPQARTLFELTRMHRILDIHETEELALEACR
jgi:anti-anti-sigma factor